VERVITTFLLPPIVEVAAERASGKEYFLEIFLIREIVEGWRKNHQGCIPSLDQALESVIFYVSMTPTHPHSSAPPNPAFERTNTGITWSARLSIERRCSPLNLSVRRQGTQLISFT
jgi:hypothetical protein